MSLSKTLYAITALFETPDSIIEAAKAVTSAGYTRFDVHTPYPVHGVDAAMQLKRTRLPFVALFASLFGTLFALFLQWWTLSVDYPLNIGGNPTFALPAFVPVVFELTVLIGVLVTIASMITIFFKFPHMGHPLLDTPFMKRVSSNKFGIVIESSDPKFDRQEVMSFLENIGGNNVLEIFDHETCKYNYFSKKFIGLLLVVGCVVSLSVYGLLNKAMWVTPFNWMSEQGKLTPQSASDLFEDGFGMRTPVEGTVARGFSPYPYKGNPAEAEANLINPLVPTMDLLAKGKARYKTFCSPCHGDLGKGDSRLKGEFPAPPSLHSSSMRNAKDGRIYHVITDGQNIMPPYAKQISKKDRWAIVYYVRVLQRALNAKESDLEGTK